MTSLEFNIPLLADEQWKQIPDFPDYYVSNQGRVLSRRRRGQTRILKGGPDSHGYLHVILYGDARKTTPSVHRLVASLFVEATDRTLGVNHKNAVKTDNRAVNLEYMSSLENTRHAAKLGLIVHGEKHHLAKLTATDVKDIRKMLRGGLSERRIAKFFGVTRNAIAAIRTQKSWKHV